jgi:secretory lipase
MDRMSVVRARLLVAVGTVLAIAGTFAAFAGSAQAAGVLLPSQDPFYDVPAGISGDANGTILATRSVSAYFLGLPDLANAWQVKYKSTDNSGNATADVTTILVPDLPYIGVGSRPLVSYQTAEDAAGSECAPSYALESGLQNVPYMSEASISSNSELETGLIELALARGWAVTVPDYEGPDSDFLGAEGEGAGVLDAIRATLGFSATDGISPTTDVAMWGYSGGSFATSVAAEMQPTYAPDLKLTAIALGGEVANVETAIESFSGSYLGGALAMGFATVNRAYPQADLTQYLNPTGLADVAAAASDCLGTASQQFPELSIADIAKDPNVLTDTPAVTNLLWSISPLGISGNPTAPVYDYHSINDEFAPIAADRQLMDRYCAAGVAVDHVESLASEHISLTVTGAPGTLAWLSGRFAGLSAPNDCGEIPAPGTPTLGGQAFGGRVPTPGSTITGDPDPLLQLLGDL